MQQKIVLTGGPSTGKTTYGQAITEKILKRQSYKTIYDDYDRFLENS